MLTGILPSYGFRLDFGFLEYDVNNDEYILTERDGTKHALPNIQGVTRFKPTGALHQF